VDESRFYRRLILFFVLPLCAIAAYHFSESKEKRKLHWSLSNDFGIAALVCFLVFTYFIYDVAPRYADYLSGFGQAKKLTFTLWALGFVLVIFPHVIKKMIMGINTTQFQLENSFGLGVYKIIGWSILCYGVYSVSSFE